MATIVGDNAAETLVGVAGAVSELISDEGGHDTLRGLLGNDTLLGGSGNDLIEGGRAFDRLSGGTGNNTFLFTSRLRRRRG